MAPMKIKYLGHSSFLIKGKGDYGENVSVVTDPFNPKSVGLKFSKQDADIVTTSHEGHGDHDNYEGVKEPFFLINTPGEFEVKGLRITGIKSYHDDKEGEIRGMNVIYTYDFQEARIAHLGDLGHLLDSSQQEALDSIDILMIPVGGIYTIDPKKAIEIIELIEPKIIIPMHYKTENHIMSFDDLKTLEEFLKEYGSDAQPQDELSIKDKSELSEDSKVIPLNISQ
jgi:L-ascorbate metabolism protein UlaG (beta-lactamase superfamily)